MIFFSSWSRSPFGDSHVGYYITVEGAATGWNLIEVHRFYGVAETTLWSRSVLVGFSHNLFLVTFEGSFNSNHLPSSVFSGVAETTLWSRSVLVGESLNLFHVTVEGSHNPAHGASSGLYGVANRPLLWSRSVQVSGYPEWCQFLWVVWYDGVAHSYFDTAAQDPYGVA